MWRPGVGPVRVLGYWIETVLAEKVAAAIRVGLANTGADLGAYFDEVAAAVMAFADRLAVPARVATMRYPSWADGSADGQPNASADASSRTIGLAGLGDRVVRADRELTGPREARDVGDRDFERAGQRPPAGKEAAAALLPGYPALPGCVAAASGLIP